MSRSARLPALLALLAVVLLVPGVALGAETKTFQDKNFKLTAPGDDWQWLEVSSDAQSSGYVARLGRRAAGTVAMADVRVVPTNGLSMSELAQEVRNQLGSNFSAVQASKTMPAVLSGLDCTLVVIKGIDKSDHQVLVKAYNLESGGVFHQLIFTLVDGAEEKQAKEIDALRRGYRLLQGAGPEEKEPEDPDALGDLGGDGDGGAPTQEGNTLTFPSHNVKWTIPEGSPFQWTATAKDETLKQTILCRAEARVEHPPAEGSQSKDPVVNRALIEFSVRPQPAGWTPAGVAQNQQNHAEAEQNFFDKVDYGRLRVIEDLEIGNYRGAAYQMVGWKEGLVRYFQLYAIGLQGEAFILLVMLTGDGSVDNDFKNPVREMLKSVEFLDTTVWVRGPACIPGIGSHDQQRGLYVGEEKEFKLLGFEAEKPKEMAHLTFNPGETGGGLRLAWETRSEDKRAYLYFDVQSWGKDVLIENRNFFEDRIKEREGQWTQNVASPVTVAKGKEPWFKSKFGKGKGLGYEFKGYVGPAPFVEEGYLVEYKKYVYWIRLQLGGENAEKIFAKTIKELKKSLKFES